MIPSDGEYKLYASEKKKTLKSRLENRISKIREGKLRSKLEKYVGKLESQEELALKMAYSFENLEIIYSSDISEEEAKKECCKLSHNYLKKNIRPMIIYGALCPINFILAFLPIFNWGFAFFFGYKFSVKYRGIKGYHKILKSKFIESEKSLNLDSIVDAST